MSLKPSWIEEVKEITEEEARLLDSLGVKVYYDYNYGSTESGWYRNYTLCNVSTEGDFWLYYNRRKEADCPIVWFVEKDKDDE